MTLERIAWYEQFWVIIGLTLSSILIFFLGVVGTILSFIYRLFKQQQQAFNSYERLAKVSTRTNCFVGLTAAALVLVMISHVMQTLSSPLLVLLPLVSLLGWFLATNSILLIAITIKLLRQKQLRLTHAMIYSFSIFAGLGFTWICFIVTSCGLQVLNVQHTDKNTKRVFQKTGHPFEYDRMKSGDN